MNTSVLPEYKLMDEGETFTIQSLKEYETMLGRYLTIDEEINMEDFCTGYFAKAKCREIG